MSQNGADKRWEEIRQIHKEYPLFYRALLVGLGVFVGWILFADKEGFAANLFSEGLGILGTFFILDWWVQKRDSRRDTERLKEDLISELGSRVNDTAIRAMERLDKYGWLRDGSLQRRNFLYANWSGAAIFGRQNPDGTRDVIDLELAQLHGSDLSYTALTWGNFKNAKLGHTDCFRATFTQMCFNGAWLTDADLGETNLTETDLRGARLTGSNLKNAIIKDTLFDDTTVLPDGSRWTEETDMSRFTDPSHPNFWQSPERWWEWRKNGKYSRRLGRKIATVRNENSQKRGI